MDAGGRPLFAGAVILLVAAAVVGGLVVSGTPGEARARRLDQRRADDLAAISRAADVFYHRRGRVPESLDSLLRQAGPYLSIRDPATAAFYGYRALDDTAYELCAEFTGASPEPPPRFGGEPWFHGAGHQCFTVRVSQGPNAPRP